MPVAAPDYYAGSPDVKRSASLLFHFAGWIRRRCNEIITEPELDALKIYDLANNCENFVTEARRWFNDGGDDMAVVLTELASLTMSAGRGNQRKTEAEINQDYKDLYRGAVDFLAWAQSALPSAGSGIPGATVVINRTWPNTDMTVTVPKTAQIAAKVSALLTLFA